MENHPTISLLRQVIFEFNLCIVISINNSGSKCVFTLKLIFCLWFSCILRENFKLHHHMNRIFSICLNSAFLCYMTKPLTVITDSHHISIPHRIDTPFQFYPIMIPLNQFYYLWITSNNVMLSPTRGCVAHQWPQKLMCPTHGVNGLKVHHHREWRTCYHEEYRWSLSTVCSYISTKWTSKDNCWTEGDCSLPVTHDLYSGQGTLFMVDKLLADIWREMRPSNAWQHYSTTICNREH